MKKYLFEDLYLNEEKHWWHVSKRQHAMQLINRFVKKKNIKILDIGCGTGKNLEYFASLGKVYGIDSSKEAIFFCKKRGLKNVVLGDATKTRFPPNSFDLVTMFDVLEHVEDHKMLKEAYRILKPGGYLLLTVPAFNILWSRWDVVLGHKRRYVVKSLEKVLKRAAFKKVYVSYKYSFLFLPTMLIRKLKSFFQEEKYTSDFLINSEIINNLLLKTANIEYNFFSNRIPFGTSITCLAKK